MIDTAAIRADWNADFEEGQVVHSLCDALDVAQRWKAEALVVLSGWDNVWRELGEPGPLGAEKWEAVRAEIERLKSAIKGAGAQADRFIARVNKAEAQVTAVRKLCDQVEQGPRIKIWGGPAPQPSVRTSRLRAILGGTNPWLLAHEYVEPQNVGALCEHVTSITADGLGTLRCNEPRDVHVKQAIKQ